MERVFIILDTPDFGPWMTNTDIFHLLDLFLILEQRIRNFIKIWGCLSKLKKIQISVWSRKPSADPSCAVALALNRPHKIFGRKRPLRTVFETVFLYFFNLGRNFVSWRIVGSLNLTPYLGGKT